MANYYLIFPTEQEALDRSEQIAIGQGCTGDITKYWFGTIVNPSTQQGAMVVPEEEESLLTPQEVDSLKDEQYMVANGWFSTNN